jgi:thiazole synthase
MNGQQGKLKIGKYEFSSRMFVGTGKYETFPLMAEALEASGTDVVTVAVRRIELDRSKESLLDYVDETKYTLLPNTAGCFNADDAVRTARLSREALGLDWVKLEVLSNPKTLLPDPIQTLAALETLVKDGFTVLCYTNDDPVTAKYVEDAGAASVMPLGSQIGSGLGVLNPLNIEIIIEHANVPVIVDAGVGSASDVAVAMELGADGVLLNTGIAKAEDPVAMARAMRLACEAGYLSRHAGRIGRKKYASASSPMTGRIEQTSK